MADPGHQDPFPGLEDDLKEADFLIAHRLHTEAGKNLSQLLDRYPGHPRIISKLDDVNALATRHSEVKKAITSGEADAIAAWAEVAARDDDELDTWGALGSVYYEVGLYAEAADACQEALERHPDDEFMAYTLNASQKLSNVLRIANEHGLSGSHIADVEFDRDVMGLLPRSFAELHNVLPVVLDGSTLTVVMAKPSKDIILELQSLTGYDIQALVTVAEDIKTLVDWYYGQHAEEKDDEDPNHDDS